MSKAEDPLVDCPLDRVHRIRASRLQFHLVRCLKNHALGQMNKVKCPFNPLHIVESVEIMHHCRSCPDSAHVVLDQYDLEGEKCFSGDIPFEEVQRQYNASIPENYQCEKYTINTPGYDPSANIENRPVLRSLSGVSKSKRKEFRYRERQRFALLEHNNILAVKAPPTTQSSQINKPLRQPHQTPQNSANIAPTNAKPAANKKIPIEKDNKVQTDKENLKTTESPISKVEENINPPPIKNQNNSDAVSETLDILTDDTTESLSDALNQLSVLNKVENAIKERKSKLMNLISANVATPTGNKVSYRDAALSKSSSDSDNAVCINPSQVPSNRKCAANFNITRGTTEDETAAGSSSKMRLPRGLTISKTYDK